MSKESRSFERIEDEEYSMLTVSDPAFAGSGVEVFFKTSKRRK